LAKELFNLKQYGVLAFKSTSQALKAERVLKEAAADFLIIPTPRQISASCGLAIKVAPKDLETTRAALLARKVEIEGIYSIDTGAGRPLSERLEYE